MPKNSSPSDLEGQVELQADQYIPFPMEEVSFDFEVIGESERDPDMVDVLLVATRTENVEQRQVAVEAAGLSARVVDVEAFAVENACQLLTHQMPDAGADKFVAIVDFGASTTTFSVLKDLKVIYTRDFAFGGQQLTEEIMRTYGLEHGRRGPCEEGRRTAEQLSTRGARRVHRRHVAAGQPLACNSFSRPAAVASSPTRF